MSGNSISSIGDFFEQTGAKYRVYDLGRRIEAFGKKHFAQFEALETAYPWPLLRHACLGIVFWYPARADERMIWFLKLPLDEQGRLSLVARDAFLKQLLDQVGQNIEALESGAALEHTSEESEFAFTPRQDRLASFHARVTRQLKLPTSKYLAHAVEYLGGETGWNQWAFVGLQGLADIAAHQDEHAALIASALPQLPIQPLEALCGALDSEPVGHEIAAALEARLQIELAGDAVDARVVSACLRGIASSPATALREEMLGAALASNAASDVEVLASVAGRCWESLNRPELLALFLEAAANNREGQGVFNLLLMDLLAIPGMRDPILEGFRQPERSREVSAAIGQFFGALRG